MKGYEDLVAGLTLLVVVLVGGYFYLNSQVIQQNKQAEISVVKAKTPTDNKVKSEKTMFEVAVKSTKD